MKKQKKKFADLEIPLYANLGLIFCKSKFSKEFNDGVETIQRYKEIGNKKYVLDYDFDIEKKKVFFGIKMIF